ncbi:MAG: flagellar basal body-associated FliL family protein [Gemmatimonadaceae bacterium]|nr:flagellar basal body-associated FliL family protein [Gemmatimonadaceae bacterium]
MADHEEEAAAEGTEKKKKGLPPFVMPLVLVLAGLGGGGFVGAKVVGPKLTAGIDGTLTPAELIAHASKKKGAHADEDADAGDGAHDEEAGDEGDEESGDHAEAKGGGEHGPAAPPPLYTLSDLVLNPAGSGGTRFLMLSVAFDMKDSAAVEVLKQRDAEIKDAVLALVGAKTVEELAEVASREPLKVEIKALVGKITKKPKAIKRVSFPQFVIQ